MFLPHPRVKLSIVGSLRDREVACSASDLQGYNFESCFWKAVSFISSSSGGSLVSSYPVCAQKCPKARLILFSFLHVSFEEKTVYMSRLTKQYIGKYCHGNVMIVVCNSIGVNDNVIEYNEIILFN